MIRRAMKLVLLLSALVGGGLVALAARVSSSIEGSGKAATEERAIGAVTEVVLEGSGELTIVRGSPAALRVSGDDNLLPYLETKTSGRKLTLGTQFWTTLLPSSSIKYTLVLPHLERVTVSGSGSVRAEGFSGRPLTVKVSGSGRADLSAIDVPELKVTVSGSGSAFAAGSAGQSAVRVSGSGDVDLATLETASAEVRVSGSGTVAVWAVDSLKVRVSGSGGVSYKGHPARIEQKATGSGRIVSMD